MEEKIAKFLKENPKLDNQKLKEFCMNEGITSAVFYGYLYDMLGAFWGAGESLEFDGEYDPEQLEMGIKVEMEHTTNQLIAERIAKDHLAEMSDYYTKLAIMEGHD